MARMSNEVTARYHKKAYTRPTLMLRKVEDKDILDYIEYRRARGETPTQMFRRLVRKDMTESVGDDVFPDFD